MRRFMVIGAAVVLVAAAVHAQKLTLPPSGDNQKSSVTQFIGPIRVTVDYSSPDVHGPSGEDRRGKIWGGLVKYGLADEGGFGVCTKCPWRAGANENTVFTVSHDVMIEGQPLKAGTYGLFMIADPAEWTVIFSKNSSSWGHYFYDPSEDALRVKVKPSPSEYNEWLTYEFTERRPDRATVALKWEDLQVPFTVAAPNIADAYLGALQDELRGSAALTWRSYESGARYALQNKRPDLALRWAQVAASTTAFPGEENFTTLSTLADAQEASGQTAEAAKTRDRALNHSSASPITLHQYARQLLNQGKKQEALRVWQLSAKRFGDTWPVNVGLARGFSAAGDYKQALKYAKLAVKQAPDPQNKQNLEAAVKKLEEGKDMNAQ